MEEEEASETQWTTERRCCCRVAVIEDPVTGRKRRFWRHWEIELVPAVVVTLLVLFCLAVYWAAVFPGMSVVLKIVSAIEIHLFAILFFVAFYMAMLMDPGFLPYNWVESRRSWYSWEEQLSHLAVSKLQFAFVEEHEYPPMSSFSKSSGRFVIRADHICGVIANWVAKRNHKQFILMLCYCSILAVSLFVWRFFPVVSSKERSKVLLGFDITACVIEALFGLACLAFAGHNLVNLYNNVTEIDVWKDKKQTGASGCHNCRQVFGDGWCMCWVCPHPAFGQEISLE